VITECFEQGNILLHSIGSSILDCSLCIAWWHARLDTLATFGTIYVG